MAPSDQHVSGKYVPLSTAAARIYRALAGAAHGLSAERLNRQFDRVAQAVASVVPIYFHDAVEFRQVAARDLLDGMFARAATVLLTTRGVVLGNLVLRRADIASAISVLQRARAQFPVSDLGDRGREDLLDRASNGESTHEVLNVLVREAQKASGGDARIAIFIADPESACLNFAAAAGLAESYTKAVDGFQIGPNQPSCGKAAYIGETVIVGDVANDTNWSPYLQLAQEHGIRACWSVPLHSSEGRLLGTFAQYHASPCEPDARQYETLRYFSSLAALVIERHKAESKLGLRSGVAASMET